MWKYGLVGFFVLHFSVTVTHSSLADFYELAFSHVLKPSHLLLKSSLLQTTSDAYDALIVM
jgi:hypothetical protein